MTGATTARPDWRGSRGRVLARPPRRPHRRPAAAAARPSHHPFRRRAAMRLRPANATAADAAHALAFEPGADVARDYLALAARLEQSLGADDRT